MNNHFPRLMGHIVAGFPNSELSLQAGLGICEAGASYLEVQFPFSDPNADGAIIEQACNKALESGFNTKQGFDLTSQLATQLKKQKLKTKLIIMSYANIVFAYGVERCLQEAKRSGVWGILVPDLPIDSDENLRVCAKKERINVISLIAPKTKLPRAKYIAKRSDKIVYVVARAGITGEQTKIDEKLYQWLESIKKNIKKPLALGFGINSNAQVKALSKCVDIIVSGSYFVSCITANKSNNIRQSVKLCAKKLMGWEDDKKPKPQKSSKKGKK